MKRAQLWVCPEAKICTSLLRCVCKKPHKREGRCGEPCIKNSSAKPCIPIPQPKGRVKR